MNDIYESYSIDTEIINEMDSKELVNLMTELKYLKEQIQNRKKVVIAPGGLFREIFNIITGKRKRIKNQIELDISEAIDLVNDIYDALDKRYSSVAQKEIEVEKKLNALLTVADPILEFANNNSIPLPQEIKGSLLLLKDTSVERSDSKYLIPAKKKNSSHYMLESKEYNNSSNEISQKSYNPVEDPKLKKKIEALKRDGYSDEEIEKEFGKLYIGLKTTDSNSTRRLKYKQPERENGKLIGNKSKYEKELNLFESRKRKIEKILNHKDNYIIDQDWIYFIDKFSRRVFDKYGVAKDEIYYCICRIRLDASEHEETVFEDVNERSYININDGMIYFMDSKCNKMKILLPL